MNFKSLLPAIAGGLSWMYGLGPMYSAMLQATAAKVSGESTGQALMAGALGGGINSLANSAGAVPVPSEGGSLVSNAAAYDPSNLRSAAGALDTTMPEFGNAAPRIAGNIPRPPITDFSGNLARAQADTSQWGSNVMQDPGAALGRMGDNKLGMMAAIGGGIGGQALGAQAAQRADMTKKADLNKQKDKYYWDQTQDRLHMRDQVATGQMTPNQAWVQPSYDPSTPPWLAARGGMAPGGMSGGIGSLGQTHGPGDGMSDSIPAAIDGHRPARLARDEFVVPADVVSHLGNGSSNAGAQHLYSMLDRVRKARTGQQAQGRQINPSQYLPG